MWGQGNASIHPVFFSLRVLIQDFAFRHPLFTPLFFIYFGSTYFFLPLYFFLSSMILGFLCLAKSLKELFYQLFFLLVGLSFTFYFSAPRIEEKKLIGRADLWVIEKKEMTWFGKTSLSYKTIVNFKSIDGKSYNNIDARLTRGLHLPLPVGHQVHIYPAILEKKESGYVIKALKNSHVTSLKKVTNLVDWRYKTKKALSESIKEFYPESKVYKFILAMAIGSIDSKTLTYEFSKTGVSHLLTISGFHFILLSVFITFLLKPFPKKIGLVFLLMILTLYVVYLGPTHSVSRSWIAIFLYLLCKLIEIPANTINHLFLAAIVCFILDPCSITSVGFQLTYLATFGILAFYPLCLSFCETLLPVRSIKTLSSLSAKRQLSYYLLSLLRKSIALDTAVNIATFPCIFYHFGSFPVFSLYYNLIIPVLVIPSLYLLILGILLSFIPPLSHWIHSINNIYLENILYFISASPKNFEGSIYIKDLSPSLAIASFFLILISMLLIEKKRSKLSLV